MNPGNVVLFVVSIIILAVGLVTLAIGIFLILKSRKAAPPQPVNEQPYRVEYEAHHGTSLTELEELMNEHKKQPKSESRPLPRDEYSEERDMLTGLYNCKAGETIITATLTDFGENATHALLTVDLDDFSNILHLMGGDIGEILLREVANVLWAQLREGDIVMRMEEDDEFLVMLPNVDPKRAMLVAQRLCDKITELSDGGKLGFETTASIGVALYPQHGTTFDRLYDSALAAMDCGKRIGKNCCKLYQAEGQPEPATVPVTV